MRGLTRDHEDDIDEDDEIDLEEEGSTPENPLRVLHQLGEECNFTINKFGIKFFFSRNKEKRFTIYCYIFEWNEKNINYFFSLVI